MGFFKSITKAFSPVVKIATAGTVDISKGRINVPGSSAQLRGLASGATLGFADKAIESKAGKTSGNLASTAVLGTGGFLLTGTPIGATLGAAASTRLWNNPPSLAATLGIGAAAAGAAFGIPGLMKFFQSSPGSGYAPSPNYGPVAVPVSYPSDSFTAPGQPSQGLDSSIVLLTGGGLALALLLTKR